MTDGSPRAQERLDLLRGMIRARRLEERRTGQPVIGDEAVVAGIAAGIGPDDSVVEGGGIPLALGLAAATAAAPRPRVTVYRLGERPVPAGELRQALRVAARRGLAVLFCREINLHPLGGPPSEAAFAAAHGIAAWSVDGMDALAVAESVEEAVEGIRCGEGPHLLELSTCRFRGRGEVTRWREFDPVRLLADRMRDEDGLGEDELAKLESEVDAELAGEPVTAG
ncbi:MULTISPECIES: thiamine pyrophosphate-dependent enzyme [Amycolatopsis]|uniref:Dehydrogenase E1 component domain-containing protein n=1 Tax=Amycolatopsis dongchuanensis TaxID=1070866 RepID=A0ABP9QN49_9PSEU